MTPSKGILGESTIIIREFETNLEKALQKQREEISRELEEAIRREREEHERRLLKIEEEFSRERETIKDYQNAIADFEAARDGFQAEIREHLDKSLGYQKDIERMTALTMEELRIVADKISRLAEVRDQAEAKIAEFRTKLREKYGIVTEELATTSEDEIVVNLEQELSKLRRIKELLEANGASVETSPASASPAAGDVTASHPEPETAPSASETAGPEPFAERGSLEIEEGPRVSFKMPEINQFLEDFVRRENENPAETSFPEPEAFQPKAEDRRAVYEELNFQAVFETLEKYRKSEPTDYDGEISFFQNRDRSILDGESLIRAVGHLIEEARKLFEKLGKTESPKDQFFMKQDLINHQEILRKILLRAVKLCERESYTLPRYTDEILNLAVLKEILDKLNMDNWSNDDDFRSFEALAGRLKDSFYKRITPPAGYLRSIVQELEA